MFCCRFIPNFFLLLFLPLFSPFLFSLSSTSYPLSIHWKSFGFRLQKNLEMEHWSTIGDLAYSATNFALKIGHVFLEKLCKDLVDVEDGHTYGWICPCCVSCLSKQSGVVKNDDITSGSMSTPPNVHKSRLSQRKFNTVKKVSIFGLARLKSI